MKKIIAKVLQELDKPEPKLDYIRGLLEAISEENDGTVAQIGRALPEPANLVVAGRQEKVIGSTPISSVDEGAILDAQAREHIAKFGLTQPTDV